MSSRALSAPGGARRTARATSAIRLLAVHDRLCALVLALLAAAISFAPRFKVGGFNADDWALYAAEKFPSLGGYHTALGALQPSAGSRVGHMFYWFVSFSLFGSHTKLYTLLAAVLAALMAFSVYLLLRELEFSVLQSLAMMLLTIVAPSLAAVRFWFTPGGVQITFILFFLGLTLALRAFRAPPERRVRLHTYSLLLYLASAIYAETALALMACSILVYLTRVDWRRALRRWALDMTIVIVGYIATLSFVSSRAGFGKLPASHWIEHARLIGGQALTILTDLLGPLSREDRTLGLAGVGALLIVSGTLWLRGQIEPSTRAQLRRWGLAFLISLIAAIAGYVVFVPAMLYYEPLSPGLPTHINIVTAAPLAVGVFSLLMLTRAVLVELLRAMPRIAYLALVLVVAWYATILVEATKHVRNDAHIWAMASARDYHVLHVLTSDLPHPVAGATVYTFGEAGTIAVGLPIFYTYWEQNNAVKVAYHRADLSSYPVVVDGLQASCSAEGVRAVEGATAVNPPSPYGSTYFFDVVSGRSRRIASFAACTRALADFQPGPYAFTPVLEWSE